MSSPTRRARTAVLWLVSVCVALVAFASLPRRQHAATASSSASTNPRLAPAHPGVAVRALAPTAGSITVNSTMDVISSTDGLCTLREAISSATNDSASGATAGECAAGSGDDTINFSVTGTINLTGALPDITSNMTINGPGSSSLTVRRDIGGDYRIFTVGGSTVGISGLTITNGKTPDGSAGGSSGGPGGDGGGILNAGTLTLTDVTVTSNRTGAGGAGLNFGGFGGSGGGIANTGTLGMMNCTVTGNSTGKGGAGNSSVGDGGNGGGLYNSGTLTMTNCFVNGNTAGDAGDTSGIAGRGGAGGGIYSRVGVLTLTNVAVGNNVTGSSLASTGNNAFAGAGGGIFIILGLATLTNCTVSGNQTGTTNGGTNGYGGGIDNECPMTITGSTISGNTGNAAGAILNRRALTITNSTVTGNHTFGNAGASILNSDSGSSLTLTNSSIAENSGFGIDSGGNTTTARNSIIANNNVGGSASSADVSGGVNSQGHNLVAKTNGSFTATGDLVGTTAVPLNPLLGPLANNGGPTQTRALLPGSPAIDGGNNCVFGDTCSPPLGVSLMTDQRGTGFNRSADGNGDGTATVDIGAFESRGFTIATTGGTPQSATITTAFTSPLVATVSSAFGEPVGGGLVAFTAPGGGSSGTFPGSVITTTVATNGSGVATSPTFTANAIPGGYNVVASLSGGSPSANFALTNTKAATTTTVTSSVNPSDFGQSVTFTATVSSVGTPTGTVQFMDGVTNLGSATCMAGAGNTCTAQVSTSALTIGTHTISATYSGDANFVGSNGTLSGGQVVKPQPTLSINDVSMAEGNSGTTSFVFTVTLSAASSLTVNVDYATANGTAILFNSDYQATSGTLTFNPGDLTRTIAVLVNGDLNREPDETFFVNLTNAVNANISRSQGVGTIVNDDAQDPPHLILDESGPDPNQAAALDSILLLRDPFRVLSVAEWFDLGADRNTRVIVFVANLQLSPGETASSVEVNLIGSNTQSYDVVAEDVRLLPNSDFAQVTFRLPDNLSAGSCTVKVKAHGQFSNSGTIRIQP